jgi:hypothetical protein
MWRASNGEFLRLIKQMLPDFTGVIRTGTSAIGDDTAKCFREPAHISGYRDGLPQTSP